MSRAGTPKMGYMQHNYLEFGCMMHGCDCSLHCWLLARAVNAAGTDFELDMKYEMIKPIGHGAYGVVISALDHETNTKVRDAPRCH